MPRYTDEEFAKKMKSLRRNRVLMAVLIPMSIVLAVLKAANGQGWFTVAISVALAVLFTVNVTYRIPLKMEKLQAEQRAE